MAGDWIQMRVELGRDPRVAAIATALKIKRAEVVGHLHAVWGWADQHVRDGRARGISLDFIDEMTLPGFGEAMCGQDWLAVAIGGLEFPDFDRHNGANAKKRLSDASRKRDSRKQQRADPPEPRGDISGQTSAKTVTREEKRREEVSAPPTPAVQDTQKTKDQTKNTVAPRRGAATAMPPGFDLTPELSAYATKTLGPTADVSALFRQFTENAKAKDLRYAKWDAAWRTWCEKALQYGFPRLPPEPGDDALSRAGRRTRDAGDRWIASKEPSPSEQRLAAPARPQLQITREREPGED